MYEVRWLHVWSYDIWFWSDSETSWFIYNYISTSQETDPILIIPLKGIDQSNFPALPPARTRRSSRGSRSARIPARSEGPACLCGSRCRGKPRRTWPGTWHGFRIEWKRVCLNLLWMISSRMLPSFTYKFLDQILKTLQHKGANVKIAPANLAWTIARAWKGP